MGGEVLNLIQDANFGRYQITEEDLTRAMKFNPKVNTALICIGEGAEATWWEIHTLVPAWEDLTILTGLQRVFLDEPSGSLILAIFQTFSVAFCRQWWIVRVLGLIKLFLSVLYLKPIPYIKAQSQGWTAYDDEEAMSVTRVEWTAMCPDTKKQASCA